VISGADFWQQPLAVREEQIPGLDPHCLICGQSLEGQPFFWELFIGLQVDVAAMHLQHAYSLSYVILRDLAATGHLDPARLKRFLEAYEQDRQAGAPHPPDVPAPE